MQPTQYGWNQPYPQPTQPRPVWKHPLVLVSSIALVFVLCGFCTLYAFLTGALQPFLLSIEPSCTVGVSGTAATITIEAWSASSDCDDMVANQGLVRCIDCSFYRYTGTPNEPVVCEVDNQGRHVIVRDEGILKIVGNNFCKAFMQQTSPARWPTSTP